MHGSAVDPEAASEYDAVIFDLDGVVTQTAAVHAAAWKRLFDAYLAERAARARHGPGGAPDDAAPALRPRGRLPPATWTASRATTACATSSPRAASSCPWATRPTRPSAETVCGLGNRKNDFFNAEVARARRRDRTPPPSS